MNFNNNHRLCDFISEERLKEKVKEMGKKIADDYKDKNLLMVGVLKGSVIFMSDLVREIPYTVEMSFISVSSYANSVATSGSVRLLCDLDKPLAGRDVLIVEDIVDSGYTLKYLHEMLTVRKPSSMKICTLLDKPSRRIADIKADYKGFEIENEFVVGYGLDYASKYRNLPYIATVRFEE